MMARRATRCSCSTRGAAPSPGRNQARAGAEAGTPVFQPRRAGVRAGQLGQLGAEEGALVHHAEPVLLDLADTGGDGAAAAVQIGEEFLEVGHGGGLDVMEGGQVGAVRPQQASQFAVELLGVGPQRLQVALQLGQRDEIGGRSGAPSRAPGPAAGRRSRRAPPSNSAPVEASIAIAWVTPASAASPCLVSEYWRLRRSYSLAVR